MEQLRIVRMRTRVSLVVALRDGYVSGPPVDRDIQVRLVGYPTKPIGKPDGTYIYTNLEPGTYVLEIESTYYFRETRTISVGSANKLVQLVLMPVSSYPFRPNETMLRAKIESRTGGPMSGALATASVMSEESVKGRISEHDVPEGSDTITVASLTGIIRPGDRLLLIGRGSGDLSEIVQIREVLDYQKRFRLEEGVGSAYLRGSLLYPVYVSRVSERGELAIAFPNVRAKKLTASLRIGSDEEEPSAVREVTVEEGVAVNLGTWIV